MDRGASVVLVFSDEIDACSPASSYIARPL